MQVSIEAKRRAYAVWLRTGRWPVPQGADGTELKFNPWHDAKDGRFTTGNGGDDASSTRQSARTKTGLQSRNRASSLATDIRVGRRLLEKAAQTTAKAEFDFASGVSDGAYDTVKSGVKSAVQFITKPISTTKERNFALAGMIDGAIAAEDTPASIQIARAAKRISHTNPHEIGYITGSIAASAAMGRATGMTLGKISAAREARLPQRSRPEFPPTKYQWAKESLRPGVAQRYNDGAPNARPGYAPAITRTLSNGSKKLVKFDGIEADWPVDRKHSIFFSRKSIDQVSRQSQALAEHHLIGLWEVPNAYQKAQALKLLDKANVRNIKVRVAKP
jgi:hypothetical protein